MTRQEREDVATLIATAIVAVAVLWVTYEAGRCREAVRQYRQHREQLKTQEAQP